jgi:hypothetical protein
MVRSIKNKRAAMEMSVGTIVTIVLLMSALVLGLVLTRTVFRGSTESVDSLNSGVQKEINNLFGEENKNLVISLGSQKTASVKQGTQNFGIPMGFSPDDPNAWGQDKDGCYYFVEANEDGNYCINMDMGWEDPEEDIITGTGSPRDGGVSFNEYQDGNGYALIKINIPEEIPPCLQRFTVLVGCEGPQHTDEATKTYFDIEVIKRGLF